MTTRVTIAFGPLLRRYRLAASLSQESLAERAGLSAATIASLERGRHASPRPDTVAMLAAALSLSDDERKALIVAAAGLDNVTTTPATTAITTPATTAAMPPITAPVTAPASQPSGAHVTDLPSVPTPLVGREHEVAAITHLLGHDRARLVTLIGPGGVGKTRLAVAAAAALRDAYADGVFFVDLSALRDAALVADRIARALGLSEGGADGARDALVEWLRARQVLLVLDNMEQVAEAASSLADLVAACPRLSVLTTSRIALRVRAEQRFPVPPLATPTADLSVGEDVGSYPAVRMFAERARAVQPDFALDADNVGAVAEICRRLDGLPLALELAAARIALLSPSALLARLEHRLAVLRGATRDLPARHQTLRATIEWSVSLLDDDDQRLLRRLSVFVGDCTLDTIETVCDVEGTLDVLDGLASLVDKSLLQRIDDGEQPRFRMLETLREYAWERLATGGETDILQRRHATYYVEQIEASRATLSVLPGGWYERWEREHDNARAALRWAVERGETELGLRLATMLAPLWRVHGHISEGRAWFERLLERAEPIPPALRAEALRCITGLAIEQGDLTHADAYCQEGLALYRQMGLTMRIADMLNFAGNIARNQGAHDRATACYEECLALCREAGDQLGIAIALNNLGTLMHQQGDLERAAALHEESLALRRATGDQFGIAFTLTNLGQVELARGRLDWAVPCLEESLALNREIDNKREGARTETVLGDVALARGDVPAAAARYVEALTIARKLNDRWLTACALDGLARVAAARGLAERAGSLFACARALAAAAGTFPDATGYPAGDRTIAAARARLDATAFARGWAAGQVMTETQAVHDALSAQPAR